MHALRNKVQLIGNLGGDPDVRILEKGKKMARFSLATHDSFRSSGGDRITETQWHTIVAWGKVAELVEQNLSKGTEVIIDGRLINRHYTDKEGNKRYVTEVHINEILMLEGNTRHLFSD